MDGDGMIMAKIHELRASPADTEKITVTSAMSIWAISI
jgi:hypothetical protein